MIQARCRSKRQLHTSQKMIDMFIPFPVKILQRGCNDWSIQTVKKRRISNLQELNRNFSRKRVFYREVHKRWVSPEFPGKSEIFKRKDFFRTRRNRRRRHRRKGLNRTSPVYLQRMDSTRRALPRRRRRGCYRFPEPASSAIYFPEPL